MEKASKILRIDAPCGEIILPYGKIKGEKAGPRVVVSAGVHGCEYASIRAAISLFQALSPEMVSGEVDVVPIVNLPAFHERVPFVCPRDGKNPNRVCPGDPDGSYSEALVWHLLHDIVEGADCYIDLHCGDLIEKIEPFSIYHQGGDPEIERRSRELTYAYGIPNIIATGETTSWPDHYTTYANAAKMGTPAFIAECGGFGQMDPKDVQTHLRGLRRVLRRLGVLQGEASGPFAAQREFSDFIWLYTPVGGIYIPEATIGDEVAEGQRVGAIVDYFGEELSELKAPAEGRILFVETTPAIPDNGLILAVGKHLNAQEEKEEKAV